MDNDINKEIEEKNQEMFLNKKKIDLDKSMDGLLEYLRNYSNNKIPQEVNGVICTYHGVSTNSEEGKIFFNTITTFFFLACEELKEELKKHLEPLKQKINELSDQDYIKALEFLSDRICNNMLDYFLNEKNKLINELNQGVAIETKNRIDKYIQDVLTIKVVNMIREQFMYAIAKIKNNNKENNQKIETIKEKTLK